MADDAPAPAPSGAPPIDYNAIIQQIMQGSGPVTGPAAPATPAVNPNLPITSLLGEAFGGGVSPLYPMSEAQQTQAGNAALLNFGINMLQNSSGPVRHSLGQAIASGLLGAQGSLAGVREGQAQMLDVQNKQQQMGLEKLKTILPLLMRQQAAGMPNPLLGGGGAPGGGGGIAATGAPITAANQGDFVQKFTPIAQTIATKTGLPLNYVLGQAGLETGWGSSSAAGNNNYFGITDPTTGKLMSYPTPQAGADAYAALMATDRYKNVPRTGSPAEIGDAMAVAGYNPNVPTKGKTDSYGTRVGSFAAGLGKPPAPPTTAAAAPTPAPVARPPAAPAAPAGTIQGTPDTGGTQVGGPGALPGVIRPPGPLVPGDVGAIVGGMTKAGASPTTLAPGTATAGPTAPTIAQGGPTTVTPPAQPTPQQPAQGDQPPAPTGPLTIEQYRAMHPSVINPTTYTVTPPNLDELRKSQAAAAQQLDMARKGLGGDPNKSLSDYTTATQAITKAQQDAQAKSLELQQAAQKNADDLTLQGYNAEMTRQQEARLKAQELAQTAAQAELERQNKIDLAKLGAGQTWHQKLQEQSAQNAQDNTLKPMAEQAAKAHQMNLGLAQLQPLLQDLPPSGGALGTVLNDHPDLAPLFNSAGILTDKSADAVRLVNGLVAGISSQMKPTGLGALREYEWDAFKSQLPSMLSTPVGQQKAIAMLMNFNNRIGSEASWMNNYFSRKVPDDMSDKPGAMMPAHNLESDNPTESVQQRMDRELGPIVPSAPPGTPQGQWEQSLPPGKPYYKSWALPDPKDPTGKTPLRDAAGNVQTKTTLEVRPWR